MFDYAQLQYLRFRTLSAYRNNGDWRQISIRDNGEKLVEVPSEIAFPYYAREMKLVSDERLFLREGSLERVFKARKELQSLGFDLIVYDGWRSVELQENLFWFYMRAFTASKFDQQSAFAGLEGFDEIRSYFGTLPESLQVTMKEANRTYVSWPSSSLKAPSPHATGGPVDVWLYKEGVPVNLGVPFDHMEDEAGAFYHLKWKRKRFSGGDRRVCAQRTSLLLAMSNAGFSCYGPEIWHFNHGNQMDALVRGGEAKYSYIEP